MKEKSNVWRNNHFVNPFGATNVAKKKNNNNKILASPKSKCHISSFDKDMEICLAKKKKKMTEQFNSA